MITGNIVLDMQKARFWAQAWGIRNYKDYERTAICNEHVCARMKLWAFFLLPCSPVSKQIRAMIRAGYEGADTLEALKSEECETLLRHVSAHTCLCVFVRDAFLCHRYSHAIRLLPQLLIRYSQITRLPEAVRSLWSDIAFFSQ